MNDDDIADAVLHVDPNKAFENIPFLTTVQLFADPRLLNVCKWAMETPKTENIKDCVLENYGMPPGIMPMNASEGATVDELYRYCYTEPETGESDPPMDPIIKITRGQQIMLIYMYGICAFIDEKGRENPTAVVRLR